MSQNGKIVLIVALLALVLLVVSYFIWNSSQKDTEDKTNDSAFEQVVLVEEEEKDVKNDTNKTEEDKEDEKEVETEVETKIPTTTDLSKFSQAKQTLGTKSTKDEYRVVSVTDTDKGEYRRITFKVEYLGADKNTSKLPLSYAEYRSDLSAIRFIMSGISEDKSNIGYQSSRDINTKGIVRIYHAVTGVIGDSTYDIGTTKATGFYLTAVELSKGNWEINLDVKYPGAVTGSTVDLGSTTFSKTKQSIVGAKTADGASASGFSYSASGGVFQLVLNVQGSATKPIPDSYAEYSGGKLQLVLTDSSDIFGNGKEYELPSIGKLTVLRSGNKSTYVLDNVSDKEFMLYGTQSPNQIILEVKL
jgi:hypothetical protein